MVSCFCGFGVWGLVGGVLCFCVFGFGLGVWGFVFLGWVFGLGFGGLDLRFGVWLG